MWTQKGVYIVIDTYFSLKILYVKKKVECKKIVKLKKKHLNGKICK